MYYLLEDNRIIEWNGDCIIKDIPKNINGVYKMKKCIIFKSETIKDGFIKKQSENVYDLIDWEEDLVGFLDDTGEYYIFPTKKMKEKIFPHRKDIFAIYKPDAKGNYIKVWEVKEDESRIN